MEYGALSLLPILTILVLAFITKRTLFAMVCGLVCASLLLGGITGVADSIRDNLYAAFAEESLQWLLVTVSLFGILLALFEKSNAVADFGLWTGHFVRTRTSALIASFLMGLTVFIDDYLSNLTVSTTMKKVTDRYNIPRVQLGYIVNTMSAPICLLFPLSSWAVYYAGLMEEQGVLVDGSAMSAYIHGLPYAFYPLFAMVVCVMQFTGVLPKLGYMKEAYARQESHLNTEESAEIYGDTSPGPWNFFIPLAVMVTVAVYDDVMKGAAAAVAAASLLYFSERRLGFGELLETCYEGIMSMGFVLILCILAFAVQKANVQLQLAEYVIATAKPILTGNLLPACTFLLCSVYAYATGCFWDLAVVIIPIVVPLSTAIGTDPIITSAAVFSGTAFGSNTCLYGDGIILCAQGCDTEPLDLMRATLPYAVIACTLSFAAYLVAGFIH